MWGQGPHVPRGVSRRSLTTESPTCTSTASDRRRLQSGAGVGTVKTRVPPASTYQLCRFRSKTVSPVAPTPTTRTALGTKCTLPVFSSWNENAPPSAVRLRRPACAFDARAAGRSESPSSSARSRPSRRPPSVRAAAPRRTGGTIAPRIRRARPSCRSGSGAARQAAASGAPERTRCRRSARAACRRVLIAPTRTPTPEA